MWCNVIKMRLSSIQVVSTAILWTSSLIFDASSSEQGVCPGGQLNLTCLTTMPGVTLLQWDFHFPDGSASVTRFISSMGSATSTLSVGQTVFRFSRTSTSPLTSLIVIDNVSDSVNGTRVECSVAGGGSLSTTTISVIRNDNIPEPIITTKEVAFDSETVTVFLEWSVQEEIRGLMYNISVLPRANNQYTETVTNARLRLSYNVHYNVSIAALCGENSSPILNIEFNYVKCVDPLSLLTGAGRQVVSTDYSQFPTIEGANVTFSCNDSQLDLEGPDSATCMENGKWEPDPRNVECILLNDDTITSTSNTESSDTESSPAVDQAPIVAALISSLIVAAVVFFVLGSLLGCAGGWFGHKRYKIATQAKSDKDANAEPAPLYKNLQPTSSTPEDQGKAFELRENVAYGPIRAINVK